jgi:imidazolonepropionase-like amidohydrolase
VATIGCAHAPPPSGTPTATPAPPPAPAPTPPPAAAEQRFTDTLSFDRPQYPSTYRRRSNPPVLIRNATILTATGVEIKNGSVLLEDGKIVSVGADAGTPPSGAQVIDGTGKFVTPGLIDTHSHMGVYAAPGSAAEQDGNEATNPVTAEVWAEHSIWPQDPQIPLAVAGGVTVAQILPGSANLIGGRSVTIRLVPSRTVQEMKYPGAPYGVKMACGENPKRVYQNRGPSTRMGNMAGYRAAFIQAEQYRERWDKWLKDRKGDPPARDLRLETLAGVLRGQISVHNHCYRADEMAQMIDIAREFGYRIRSFHHAVEGYKIADLLARDSIAASVWADWGGFKLEAADAVRGNMALLTRAGVRTVMHSDDPDGEQRLNQEAAKAMAEGNRIGVPITEDDAVKWMTINPAWTLGIDDVTGSIEPGKNADVVLWSGDPFSVYSRAEKVWIDGAMLFDRLDPAQRWRTDFELGFVPENRGGAR